MNKLKLILSAFLFLLPVDLYASCDRTASNFIVATASILPKKINYNKYDNGTYVGGEGAYEIIGKATITYPTVFTCTSTTQRRLKARMTLLNEVAVAGPEGIVSAYRLRDNDSIAVAVRVANNSSNAVYQLLNTMGSDISDYSGYSNGVKIEVITYLKKGYASSGLVIENVEEIASLYLTTPEGVSMPSVSDAKISYSINSASIQLVEHACSLNGSTFSLALNNISIRNLNFVGQDATIAPKTLNLNINCPYLQNGGGRRIKAYITDGLNLSNTGTILQNKEGAGFATGVGVRLRDKDNNIIGLDPAQSKIMNEWTFGNIQTNQNISHSIKANYARTANKVTAGNVEAKALLNIVYD